jgi:hypothetical protein
MKEKHVSNQESRSGRETVANSLRTCRGLATGVIIGFACALIFCYFTWIRDLQVHLVAKEKALNDWAELNRQERARIMAMQNISVDVLKRWVAAVDAENTAFIETQRRLHQLELAVTGPGTTYIVIAVCGLVVTTVLVFFSFHAADRDAATTLENVASLAPEAMLQAVLVKTLAARKEPLTISLENRAVGEDPSRLPDASDE